MRRVLIILLVGLLGLTGCAKMGLGHNHKNLQAYAQSVPPMKIPPGVSMPAEKNYYAVPPITTQQVSKPSLVPPGSKILQSQHSSKNSNTPSVKEVAIAAPRVTVQPKVKWASWNAKGHDLVIKNINLEHAWAKIGKALRKTPYQILDKDRGMGAYYILDAHATGNQITKQTPIYFIHVTQSGKNVIATLLNQSNKSAKPQIAKRILLSVQQQLS